MSREPLPQGHKSTRAQRLAQRFTELYGRPPQGVWRAPGRVNLIGEHTDYNHGLVLPFAIDRSAMVAVRLKHHDEARPRTVHLATTHTPEAPDTDDPNIPAPEAGDISRATFVPVNLEPGSVEGWAGYPAGIVHALSGLGGVHVPGFELLLDSTVPVGAGLSSSHAVEVATIIALNDLLHLRLSHPELVALTQQAENNFVGAPTGIMDQSASLMGRSGGALFLDCRSLESRIVPLPLAERGLSMLVIDTKVVHSHADSGYADRRTSCERAASALGVASLRDLSTADTTAADDAAPADDAAALASSVASGARTAPTDSSGNRHVAIDQETAENSAPDMTALDEETARRVRHVLTENRRVLETVRLLDHGDLSGVGELMTASHVSLRDDYQVSCPELDLAVDSALDAGALGARMTGGSFGGSAIALVRTAQKDRVGEAVLRAFAERGLRAPDLFTVLPADGARRLS